MEARTYALKNGQMLSIREARADDAEAVVRHVHAVSAETDNFSFGAGEFEGTTDDLREGIEQAASLDNSVFLLAFVEEELVGLISIESGKRPRNVHAGEVSISVRQSHWGLGIGAHLMQTMIEWAQGTGIIRKLNLTVRADNAAAIALYEKVGFVKEGMKLRDLFINGEFVDTCRMGMEIDPQAQAATGGEAV